MTPSTHDWTALSLRAVGPVAAALAFLLAFRDDLGATGGALAGLLVGLLAAAHLLVSGVAASRRALPVSLLLGGHAVGAALIAAGWSAPLLALFAAPNAPTAAYVSAAEVAAGLRAAGALLLAACATQLIVLTFVARAPDLSDEAW